MTKCIGCASGRAYKNSKAITTANAATTAVAVAVAIAIVAVNVDADVGVAVDVVVRHSTRATHAKWGGLNCWHTTHTMPPSWLLGAAVAHDVVSPMQH